VENNTKRKSFHVISYGYHGAWFIETFAEQGISKFPVALEQKFLKTNLEQLNEMINRC